MNKIVFVTLMVWTGLTAAAGFAAGQPAIQGAAPPGEHAARVARTPMATWTCAHNTYRSVACP